MLNINRNGQHVINTNRGHRADTRRTMMLAETKRKMSKLEFRHPSVEFAHLRRRSLKIRQREGPRGVGRDIRSLADCPIPATRMLRRQLFRFRHIITMAKSQLLRHK